MISITCENQGWPKTCNHVTHRSLEKIRKQAVDTEIATAPPCHYLLMTAIVLYNYK